MDFVVQHEAALTFAAAAYLAYAVARSGGPILCSAFCLVALALAVAKPAFAALVLIWW